MIGEKDGIVSFDLLRIERGREKICVCDPPSYVIDEANHIVTCEKCGAVVEAFDALIKLSKYVDVYTKYQERALEKIKAYKEMADKEFHRKMKNAIFKDMDKQYQNGMYPCCPNCKKMIDPIKIDRWVNKKFYE